MALESVRSERTGYPQRWQDSASERPGTVHAARLLPAQPALAAEQAAEILKVAPDHPVATRLLAVAHRACGDATGALERLQQLCRRQPGWAAAQYELGMTLGNVGQGEAAIAALRRAVALKPDMPDAWRALADRLAAIGDAAGARSGRGSECADRHGPLAPAVSGG